MAGDSQMEAVPYSSCRVVFADKFGIIIYSEVRDEKNSYCR